MYKWPASRTLLMVEHMWVETIVSNVSINILPTRWTKWTVVRCIPVTTMTVIATYN